ncbi:MAG: DUF1320 domain-containing protein [Pseudomonadota bacterium]
MTYATLDLLVQAVGERMLIQLTDREEQATGEVDADAVARALADTDADINGYLAGRYRLPIEGGVPAKLASVAIAISLYKLHRFTPDDKIAKDYDRAIADLGRIASGVIRLEIEGAEPASSGAGGVETSDRDRPLTAESLRGFI